jgi:hypothetical protein
MSLIYCATPRATYSGRAKSARLYGPTATASLTRQSLTRLPAWRKPQVIFAMAQRDPDETPEQINGASVSIIDEPPPVDGPGDYYSSNGKTAEPDDEAAFGSAPPLTIEEWLARDLPAPNFIMGSWLSTTTRGLLVGPTGLGKTNLALALTLYIAAGKDFLHWRGQKPCKVLYVDGEMSRRLFRQRIEDAVARLGERPVGFYALSHEDVEKFAPLNSAAGQAYIERLIAQIGPDFIVFDSIMCLLTGDTAKNATVTQPR